MDASTGALYCYHFDATGNTVAMTNASQVVVNQYAYTPFGEIAAKSETWAQPFTYVGQYGVFQESDNIYYMRARYYDASVGRFVSEDPKGFDGGDVNLYAYVQNNPILWNDPLGSSKTKGILQGDDKYLQDLKATQGNREAIKEIERAAKAGHATGEISESRWKNIKAWIKLAKDGRLFSEPIMLIVGPQILIIENPGTNPSTATFDKCGRPSA